MFRHETETDRRSCVLVNQCCRGSGVWGHSRRGCISRVFPLAPKANPHDRWEGDRKTEEDRVKAGNQPRGRQAPMARGARDRPISLVFFSFAAIPKPSDRWEGMTFV